MTRSRGEPSGDLRGSSLGWLARACAAAGLLACGCGGVTSSNSQSVIRFELTTAQSVSGLAQVRLTAGSNIAMSVALQTLSPTPKIFDLPIPSYLTGTIEVSAVARPIAGCSGYGAVDVAFISAVGQTATVTLLLEPKDICQTSDAGVDATGTAGAGGTTGTAGTTGTGGTTGMAGTTATGGTTGTAGTGGTTAMAGRGGGGGSAGVGGSVGGGGAGGGGRSGTVGTAGIGGSVGGAGGGGRGGTVGSTGGGGRGGVAGTGTAGTGVAGTGVAGTGVAGTGGTAGPPSCSVAAGGRPAPVAPPSLTRCIEYSHNDSGAVCNQSTGANNPYINDIAVSPDGQYMATAGSHDTVGANDRVKIWRLVGSTPTQCASIDISRSGLGPPYVAWSPDGQYLAVAWRADYVYVYSFPGFALVGSIGSSVGPLYGVGWSADSQTVFSVDYDSLYYDGTLYADRPNGTAITWRTLGVDPDVLAVSPVMGANNTSTIAVGGFNGTAGVYTFNGTTFSPPTILSTAAAAASWAIRFSPSGNLLGVGTNDGVVRFWNIPLVSTAPSGTPITVGGTVFGLWFSPQGTHVGVGFGSAADIWNVSTRAFVSRAATIAPVDSLAFSASGAALIVGERTCGQVLICAD